MNDIEVRLQALEAQVRRWRRVTLGLLTIGALGLSLGASRAQGVTDVIQARRLEVLRDDGTLAVVLDGKQGGAVIELRRGSDSELVLALSAEDAGGIVRMGTGGPKGERSYGELGPKHWNVHGTEDQLLWEVTEAEQGGGSLQIFDDEGTAVCELAAQAGGAGRCAVTNDAGELTPLTPDADTPIDTLRVRALELLGEGDAVIATLAKNESGGASLELRAKGGAPVIRLGQGPAGHGRVELRARAGGLAVDLTATDLGEGTLTLLGHRERPLVRFGPKHQGALPLGGQFTILNYNGEEVVRAGVDTDGKGELGVYDRSGKGRVIVPH